MNNNMSEKPELSIILPCQNEELALGLCLEQIKHVIDLHHMRTL